jgi:NAD-dependent deacetylase
MSMSRVLTLETAAESLADAIAAQQGLLFVLTGAGVSVASGIPTFRGSDPGAVWANNVVELGTHDFFRRDPVRSWQWYRERFAAAAGARPNDAHRALAALEHWQVERGATFLLVTQNIDTLHEQAGSSALVKVHGSADRARCSRASCAGASRRTEPIANLDFDPFERRPGRETIPRCRECGSLMRPHVLWFDELYTGHQDYQWSRVMEAAERMRLALIVGTSMSVGVTDFIQSSAEARQVPTFMVDPGGASRAAGSHVMRMPHKAEELLPLVCGRLMDRA